MDKNKKTSEDFNIYKAELDAYERWGYNQSDNKIDLSKKEAKSNTDITAVKK